MLRAVKLSRVIRSLLVTSIDQSGLSGGMRVSNQLLERILSGASMDSFKHFLGDICS